MLPTKEIIIKYHGPYVNHLEFVGGIDKSNWIDLYCAEDVILEAGTFGLINLGVSMKLPDGYEAHIVPRSSTFKKFGIIQTNGMGIIDGSYYGDMDIWMMPVYATRATYIKRNERVCQFRIMPIQNPIDFVEVEVMEEKSRGGFGSTDEIKN